MEEKLFMPPNPVQEKLIEAWGEPKYKVFTATGANRIGKCQTYQTLIDTPNGEITIGELFEKNEPFDVYAWDGEKKVIARAKAPFKKRGLHQCYRITLADGRWVEPADFHLLLTSLGWRTVHQIYTLWNSLQESISGTYLSVLPSGVVNLFGTPLGYRDDCFESFRQYGEPPRYDQDNDLVSVPLQDGVRQNGVPLLRSDGLVNKDTNNHPQAYDRLSNTDDHHQNEGRCVGFESDTYDKTWKFSSVEYQFSRKPSTVEVSEPLLGHEVGQHQSHVSCSYIPPASINRIISIKSISPCQEVYDFEVEKYHNYFAGGLIHHNTTLECIIGLSTMFGFYPWNEKKLNFGHKRPRKVRWVGQAWESHIKAVIMTALKFWWPQCRPVETKKNNQGVESTWKDTSTGSQLEIMSNSQESEMFEGWEGDLVIYDEPPKRDVRVACARGLIDRNGRELFGATLLKEAWIHREIIKARLDNGQVDPSVFNVYGQIYDNVGFGLTTEGVEQFAKSLKPEEKEARLYGKPSYMSSLVFPRFSRDLHVKKSFKIPLDWIVDASIDFHPSKPWAIVFLATARNNFKYVCKEMEIRGNPKFVGEEIIRYVKDGNLRVGKVTIDPLSRGDKNAHEDAQTVFDILSSTLGAHNISLDVASKDKDNGIALVNNLLWTENEMPGLFFFEECVKTIQQTEDLMYDIDSLKPIASKIEDDFTECLYRCALLDTQWYGSTSFNISEQRSMML